MAVGGEVEPTATKRLYRGRKWKEAATKIKAANIMAKVAQNKGVSAH